MMVSVPRETWERIPELWEEGSVCALDYHPEKKKARLASQVTLGQCGSLGLKPRVCLGGLVFRHQVEALPGCSIQMMIYRLQAEMGPRWPGTRDLSSLSMTKVD